MDIVQVPKLIKVVKNQFPSFINIIDNDDYESN
jgi:hypothetical protein